MGAGMKTIVQCSHCGSQWFLDGVGEYRVHEGCGEHDIDWTCPQCGRPNTAVIYGRREEWWGRPTAEQEGQ